MNEISKLLRSYKVKTGIIMDIDEIVQFNHYDLLSSNYNNGLLELTLKCKEADNQVIITITNSKIIIQINGYSTETTTFATYEIDYSNNKPIRIKHSESIVNDKDQTSGYLSQTNNHCTCSIKSKGQMVHHEELDTTELYFKFEKMIDIMGLKKIDLIDIALLGRINLYTEIYANEEKKKKQQKNS